MATLARQLALVSESRQIPKSDVQLVSAALQKQATRDLGPIWEVAATIDSFDTLEDVPVGYWPLIVMDDIDEPGAAGIHKDQDGQPFALITASEDLDTWSLTASHEALEMLVDPFGSRVVAGDSPDPEQGRVSILLEVCDPCEAAEFAYTVNGILVSDFITPRYLDPVAAPGVRYSYTGAITEPHQVLRGGYLSWQEVVSHHWWQEIWFGNKPEFRDLGPMDESAYGNPRSFVDRKTMADTMKAIRPGRKLAAAAGVSMHVNARSSSSKANVLRNQINELLGRKKKVEREKPGVPRSARRPRPFDGGRAGEARP